MSAHVCADRRKRLLSLLVLGVLAERDARIPDRYIQQLEIRYLGQECT
jgi:hypothetical protein